MKWMTFNEAIARYEGSKYLYEFDLINFINFFKIYNSGSSRCMHATCMCGNSSHIEHLRNINHWPTDHWNILRLDLVESRLRRRIDIEDWKSSPQIDVGSDKMLIGVMNVPQNVKKFRLNLNLFT